MKSMIFRINILLLLILPFFTLAQTPDGKVHWVNGKKFVSYEIQAKDTWTALSSKYGINIKDLQSANPGVSTLKIGQKIFVPSEKGNPTIEAKPVQTSKNTTHTVQKGETLYRISKMYNQSLDDIKKWNNLTSDNVSLGKVLIVAKGTTVVKNDIAVAAPKPAPKETAFPESPLKSEPGPVKEVYNDFDKPIKPEAKPEPKENKAEPVKEEKAEPVKEVKAETPVETKTETPVKENEKPEVTKEVSADGVEKITETGVATWLTDQELNQNKFYALHRTAPIGTIIKVTNRMTNNSVFVKVVGILPDTGDNANIIIKITQAAAQRIGAIDQKFTAELSYGISK